MTETIAVITSLINSSLESLGFDANHEIKLEHPADENFGDYSSNIAMILAKELKKNPRELALQIKENIEQQKNNIIEKVEVAGPGFINFYLTTSYLFSKAGDAAKITFNHGKGKKVVVEYSSPNIAKPFGIGHLRSTNIGQAIYNIYKRLGWNTVGDNHIGDWGTQFGKMMTAISKYQEGDVRFQMSDVRKTIEELNVDDLERLYVAFHKAAETDENLIDEGREWFAKLEQGDTKAKDMWQLCVNTSLREFNRVYEMLGVKIDNTHGEAFYEPMLNEVIDDFKKAGLTRESEGALIVEFDDMPPAILLKSNKTTTYFTRDLATIKFREQEWDPDLIIYEVGMEQILHFKQVFAASEKIGWIPKNELYHLPHGLIRWATGKFSTRKGDTIHLTDIINKAIEGAQKVADESVVSKEMSVEERENMIRKVAIGAVKFTDLASDPRKDVIFDWDKMMNLQGDSGPYLQYTYSRAKSVLTKAGFKLDFNVLIDSNVPQEETALIRELAKYEEKLLEAADRYSPAVMAEHLLAVARKFNEFYAKYKIINAPDNDKERRLALTMYTAQTLQDGLKLLGIETVERM